MTRKMITFLLGIGAIYVLVCIIYYFMQTSIIFQPYREIEATPRDIGLAYEDLTLTTSDGIRINAWYIPAADARGTFLFCHGNAGNISHRLESIRIFHELGLNVLIFDYRGYGKSEGAPGEEGTYADAEAAWAYLAGARKEKPGRIVLFGRSLGSAVAAEMALRRKAGALIMESAFSSIADMGRRLLPLLPVSLLVRHKYATIDKVAAIDTPKLIIHSPQDEIIPFEQGRRLYEQAAEPRQFLQIAGDHNGGFMNTGARYIEGLDSFISNHIR